MAKTASTKNCEGVVKSGPNKGRLKPGYKYPGGGKCPVKVAGKAKSASAPKITYGTPKAPRKRDFDREVRRCRLIMRLADKKRTSPYNNPAAVAHAYKPEGIMGARTRRRRRRR